MKQVKRWRYYCDYCNKAGGSKFHMINHEKFCTMNPNRICKMCTYTVAGGSNLNKMILIVKNNIVMKKDMFNNEVWSFINGVTEENVLNKLRSESDCPACILAAIRQNKVPFLFLLFDYKAERKAIWKDHNKAQEEELYYYD